MDARLETMREAIRQLAGQGVLSTRQGSGNFLRSRTPVQDWDALVLRTAIGSVIALTTAVLIPVTPASAAVSIPPNTGSIALSAKKTVTTSFDGGMKRYYGTDAVTFTATTEDPHAVGVTRTFTTFSAAANEDAMSRLWLGVHYGWDADYGLSTGENVAGYVFGNRLR